MTTHPFSLATPQIAELGIKILKNGSIELGFGELGGDTPFSFIIVKERTQKFKVSFALLYNTPKISIANNFQFVRSRTKIYINFLRNTITEILKFPADVLGFILTEQHFSN